MCATRSNRKRSTSSNGVCTCSCWLVSATAMASVGAGPAPRWSSVRTRSSVPQCATTLAASLQLCPRTSTPLVSVFWRGASSGCTCLSSPPSSNATISTSASTFCTSAFTQLSVSSLTHTLLPTVCTTVAAAAIGPACCNRLLLANLLQTLHSTLAAMRCTLGCWQPPAGLHGWLCHWIVPWHRSVSL